MITSGRWPIPWSSVAMKLIGKTSAEKNACFVSERVGDHPEEAADGGQPE